MRFVTTLQTGTVRRLFTAVSLGLIVELFCLSALVWAQPVTALCLRVVHPKKESSLKTTELPGDFTQKEASITIHFEGSGPNTQPQTLDPPPSTFVLGNGGTDAVFGTLAGQGQESVWNIKGVFNAGRTLFTGQIPQNVAFFGAGACLDTKPGTSLASTTFKVAGGFNGGTAKITAGEIKDDAFVDSDFDTVSHARGSLRFTLDGTTALDVETLLQAHLGATASIVDEGPNAGLSLFAAPGQIAAFSVIATDPIDPSQSFSWSAIFNGTGRPFTTANGVSDPRNFFMPIIGGWFLPFDAMPAHDLTADLNSGQLEFTGVASADISSVCDIDGDGVIDRNDIDAIFAARGTPAAPGDPRDADGDGVITVNDARICALRCTNPNCAP